MPYGFVVLFIHHWYEGPLVLHDDDSVTGISVMPVHSSPPAIVIRVVIHHLMSGRLLHGTEWTLKSSRLGWIQVYRDRPEQFRICQRQPKSAHCDGTGEPTPGPCELRRCLSKDSATRYRV